MKSSHKIPFPRKNSELCLPFSDTLEIEYVTQYQENQSGKLPRMRHFKAAVWQRMLDYLRKTRAVPPQFLRALHTSNY